jgi:hypothetical protein
VDAIEAETLSQMDYSDVIGGAPANVAVTDDYDGMTEMNDYGSGGPKLFRGAPPAKRRDAAAPAGDAPVEVSDLLLTDETIEADELEDKGLVAHMAAARDRRDQLNSVKPSPAELAALDQAARRDMSLLVQQAAQLRCELAMAADELAVGPVKKSTESAINGLVKVAVNIERLATLMRRAYETQVDNR